MRVGFRSFDLVQTPMKERPGGSWPPGLVVAFLGGIPQVSWFRRRSLRAWYSPDSGFWKTRRRRTRSAQGLLGPVPGNEPGNSSGLNRPFPSSACQTSSSPGRGGSDEFEGAGLCFGHGGQGLPLQHDLDGIPMELPDPPEDEERLLGTVLLQEPEEELCHHLVGTGEVDDGHLGQVDDREADGPRLFRQDVLDGQANRLARGPGHQGGVEGRHIPPDQSAHIDGDRIDTEVRHRPPSWAGRMIWIWAPGKAGRFSSKGGSVIPVGHIGDSGGAAPDGDGSVPTPHLFPDLLDSLAPPRIREPGQTVDEGRLQGRGVSPPIPESSRVGVRKGSPEALSDIGHAENQNLAAQSFGPGVGLSGHPTGGLGVLDDVLAHLREDDAELNHRRGRIVQGLGKDRPSLLLDLVHHGMNVGIGGDGRDLEKDVGATP